MNPTDSFDRNVSDWLHVDAEHRVPAHLDAVLRRTRSERQRPAWSSLERWLPMESTARFAPVPRFAWVLAIVGPPPRARRDRRVRRLTPAGAIAVR